MLNLFYDSPQRQPDLSCVEQVKAPEFIAPLMTTDLFAQLSLIATEDKNKLAKPIVWVGVSVLLLVIGLFVHSINWFINRTSEKKVYVASARPLSWLASVTAFTGLAVFAAAAAATINVTETLILFGLSTCAVGQIRPDIGLYRRGDGFNRYLPDYSGSHESRDRCSFAVGLSGQWTRGSLLESILYKLGCFPLLSPS